jgi:hypothetical protein
VPFTYDELIKWYNKAWLGSLPKSDYTPIATHLIGVLSEQGVLMI